MFFKASAVFAGKRKVVVPAQRSFSGYHPLTADVGIFTVQYLPAESVKLTMATLETSGRGQGTP